MNYEASSLELLLLVGPNNSSLFDFSLLALFFSWKIPLHYVQQSIEQTKRGGKKESTLPSVILKQDTPCESSTIIKLTFLDFCTPYFYRSTMLLKSWWPNLFYFIYLIATFFLLGSARYRLGISMGSLRKYPVTVVPNHPQNHSSDIQTHKLPYSLGLSWPKCDYPKHS